MSQLPAPHAPPFVNWARNVRSQPVEWHSIHSEEQLSTVVQQARQRGLRVRALGSRHSWSPTAAPDSIALEMHGYNRMLSVDKDAMQVTVESGMRLRDLNDQLAAEGLAVPILGSVTAQTVAGATATGTHGSSLQHGPLSSLIEKMTVLNGNGELVTMTSDSPELQGGRVHLGALGLVSTVTLRVEPAFLLEEVAAPMPWDKALADLPALARSAEYIKLWWLPHTDQIQVFRYERVEKPVTFSKWGRWLDEKLVNRHLFRFLLWLGKLRPQWIPGINRALEPQYFNAFNRVGRSFDVLTLAMPPVHQETEYSVPLERAAQTLEAVRAMIEREKFCVNFIVEARFVPAETSWMSPAHGRDSCHIGLYMAETRDRKAYFEQGQAILWENEGRPHWGKEFQQDETELLKRYPEARRFQELARSLDPDGLFHNPFLQRILEASTD